jgi:hypothetical protein
MTAPAPCHRYVSIVAAEDGIGPPPSPERRVRRKEAARYITEVWGIPMSPKTLAKLAVTGGGPPYRKAGKFPLYEITALDEFAKTKLSPLVSSTSELQATRRCDGAGMTPTAAPNFRRRAAVP